MIRRPPRSTHCISSAASDVYKRQANICERVGADANQVRIGIGSDKRIGYSFIYPGAGYGGSCFLKDVKALQKIAKENGYNPNLITAVEEVNDAQKLVIAQKIVKRFGEDLTGYTFGLWGLAFKPGTDDMREAPSIYVVKELISRGAKVQAYDPKAIEEAKEWYLHCLLYTSPSPRDLSTSRMPSSA